MFVFRGEIYRQAADVHRDTEWQRRLHEAYEKFIRIISTKSGVAKMFEFPQERIRRKMERGMAFPGTLLDPDFTDVDIVITHRPDRGEGTLGAGGYVNLNRQTGRYELVLGPDVWGDYELPFPDAMRARGFFKRDTFLHELTHYLDIAKRWKGQSPFKEEEEEETEEEASGKWESPKYYNNPLEFNAYFQAGAARLNSYFQEVMRRKAARRNRDLKMMFAQPFEQFANRATGWFRNEWIRQLNKRNQRAFIKRLYNLYQPMHQIAVETLEKSKVEPYSGVIIPYWDDYSRPRKPFPKVYEDDDA